jgi:hypothetical protein
MRKNGGLTRREVIGLAALNLVAGAPGIVLAAAPSGQLTWGVHISLPTTWLDPADTPAILVPLTVLYALHDALVKPMPRQAVRAEPRRVVVDIRGRAQLPIRAPPGSQIP